MPNADTHSPGSFCWIELATTDQNAAKTFYEALFGWSAIDSPMGPDEVYTMFTLAGRSAGAAYTVRPEHKGMPPNWMLYVATANADTTAARAGELGGTVVGGPFDVATYGRMAVIQDPTGAMFSIWQAMSHPGLGVTGENGALCWADLSTPDAEKASQFYSSVFGWTIKPGENDPSGYLHITNGDVPIGGIQPASMRNPHAPPHWLIYILVADCDASAAKATELGGRLLVPPMDIEKVGRFSVISDPQGAVFAIFKPA